MQIELTWDCEPQQTSVVRKALRLYCLEKKQLPCWNEEINKKTKKIGAKIRVGNRTYRFTDSQIDTAIILTRLRDDSSKKISPLNKVKFKIRSGFKLISQSSVALAIIFFPKCPLCWAAYFSFSSALGISIPYLPWVLPLLYILLIVTAVLVFMKCRLYKYESVTLISAGILLIMFKSYIGTLSLPAGYTGFIIVFTGVSLEPILVRLSIAYKSKSINI